LKALVLNSKPKSPLVHYVIISVLILSDSSTLGSCHWGFKIRVETHDSGGYAHTHIPRPHQLLIITWLGRWRDECSSKIWI